MSIAADVSKHLFRDLVDDAAMFPPGNAEPATALKEHGGWRAHPHADVIGPLLVRADRWDELVSVADSADEKVSTVVIGDVHPPALEHPLLTVVGYEVAWSGGELPAAPGRLAVEPATAEHVEDLLAEVGEARIDGRPVIAKFRTGGTTPDAFPTDEELATSVWAAYNAGVPFKLTAGLHHAVRHTGPDTGFEHHGFLNVMAAAHRCAASADIDELAAVLGERDVDAVAGVVAGWSVDDALNVRSQFVSFGCCGVGDPLADLTALGLIGGVS